VSRETVELVKAETPNLFASKRTETEDGVPGLRRR